MDNNFKLFILKDEDKNSRKGQGELLIKKAALFYGVPEDTLAGEKICRSEEGKPFFENLNIHFSVSHSGNLWACLMGPFNCGLDVQYIKPCNFTKIAGRFFSQNECKYVESKGLDGFFEIWVRREAFGKYTGEGFFGNMAEFVMPDGHAADRIACPDGRDISFRDIYLADGIKCAVCAPGRYIREIEVCKNWKGL